MKTRTFEDEIAMYGRAYVDGIPVYPFGLNGFTEKEARAYIEQIRKEYPHEKIDRLEVKAEDGGNVSLDFSITPPPFERIRRITGYLVGTLDRFNDAKRAEEHDRVKHTLRDGGMEM